MARADIDFLVGQHFVASSGNTATFRKLHDGALRATWVDKSTHEDRVECKKWIRAALLIRGQALRSVDECDARDEAARLTKWLERTD